MSHLVSVVLVADTPAGPVDIDSIDGPDVIVTAPDGELMISNGVGSLFGGAHAWTVDELLASAPNPPTPGTPIRIEIRVLPNPEGTRP